MEKGGLRVAMLAPPWIPVPAPGYGGIEEVVRLLCRGMVLRGHDVTLLAAPGSDSAADVVTLLDEAHPDQIEHSVVEASHVAAAFDAIDAARDDGRPFDVVHDHCPAMTLAMADRLQEAVVHTLHSSFTDERSELYRRHGHKSMLVALSEAQRAEAPEGVICDRVIPNPIDLDEWPFSAEKDDSLLFIGRLDPDKGPHRAIAAATAAGSRLTLAGPVQPDHRDFFAREVEPLLDGEWIRYVGPVAGAERAHLFSRSRALLMPIDWPEPFGLVMVESLATGTPVIAFNRGSAPEIVLHGETGFLVDSVEEMADAIHCVDELDPASCRESVETRFGLSRVLDAYEQAYTAVCDQPNEPSVSVRT